MRRTNTRLSDAAVVAVEVRSAETRASDTTALPASVGTIRVVEVDDDMGLIETSFGVKYGVKRAKIQFAG